MKKKIILIFTFISFYSFSQKIEMKDAELQNILCKTWKVDFFLINNQKVNGFENGEIEFKKDNTFVDKSKPQNSENTWKYNKSEKCIDVFADKTLISRIRSLSSEKLIYEPIIDEVMKEQMKSAEMHLIPSK